MGGAEERDILGGGGGLAFPIIRLEAPAKNVHSLLVREFGCWAWGRGGAYLSSKGRGRTFNDRRETTLTD